MSEQEVQETQEGNEPNTGQSESSWRDVLPAELRDDPILSRHKTPESAYKSLIEINKKFSADHVVWPKGDDDVEGWANINQKLGVPSSPDEYGLEAVKSFDGNNEFDNASFQNKMKEMNVPKNLAGKLWDAFTGMVNGIQEDSQKELLETFQNNEANLRKEWGQDYDTNIKLGQTVIDKFSDNQEQSDYITATMAKDPLGIKFLAKLGKQFSENSVGDFHVKPSYNLSVEDARKEQTEIRNNPDFTSPDIKVRQPLINRMNDLSLMISRK